MPSHIVQEKGITQITDPDLIANHVKEVLRENPEILTKYNSGQQNVVGFLVGQVMKKTSGRANPELVKQLSEKHLIEG
jgi:aspartyl-tRNA(Asn)/glutamyl-tRNA(Gln) amidotransferase subunit B